MSKDPAFLFYPNDWLGGTMGMSLEEKGAYIELLVLQFNRGHMTDHMVGQQVGQIWDKVSVKFKKDTNGLWYNERLDDEKSKRKTFTDSRKNNLLGTNQYSKKNGHMTNHMENRNENENTSRRGIRFDENFEKVYFEDGSYQNLGIEQKALAETGDIKPATIIKNSIY